MSAKNSSNDQPSKSDNAPLRPAMAKLVAAIAEKRRNLGFTEWGTLPIEEVVEKIAQKSAPDPEKSAGSPKKQDNIQATRYDPPQVDDGDLPPLI